MLFLFLVATLSGQHVVAVTPEPDWICVVPSDNWTVTVQPDDWTVVA